MNTPIPEGFIVHNRINGMINTRGQKAGIEQNWAFEASDPHGQPCILLFCNPGVYTIIDTGVLERIRVINDKTVSWYQMKTGYIACHTNDTVVTLHQFLMNHMGYGKGGPSVDHINQNKLDNRISNLRIVLQSTQNQNRGKVSRHKNAVQLPPEISDITLPKFVVFYNDKVSKIKTRQFFTVEGHALQKMKKNKIINQQTTQLRSIRWATTKSNSIPIKQKLEMAIHYLTELDKLEKDPTYHIQSISISIDDPLNIGMEEEKENMIVPEEEIKLENQIITPSIHSPKQWKARQIYTSIQENNENEYKTYCEKHNDMSNHPDWNTAWIEFVQFVKGKTWDESKKPIQSFVENLRRIRHNILCASKNPNPIERNDRKQWPSAMVVRVFCKGQINTFKKFIEENSNENPDDPQWIKRWNIFIQKLEEAKSTPNQMKEICSKFMTAERMKKYRVSLSKRR